MDCPICSFPVADARGLAAHFRHQAATHPNYAQWQEDLRFSGKAEGVDFVRCLECGHRADSLARHLKSEHGVTADQYRVKHGLDTLIRASAVKDKMADAARSRQGGHGKGGLKEVVCPACGAHREASKFLVPGTHDLRCDACKAQEEATKWTGLSEPEDYVSCLECSYRAENLTSHTQNAHPGYRDRHPDALMVALGSSIRNKECLKGKTLSSETRQLMSENAGRWNKGMTKVTHPSLASISEQMLGRPSWNKGLTAENHLSVARTSVKLRMYEGGLRPWDNGLAADLTLADFQPFLDADGRVDHRAVLEATGISWVTVRKYIVDLGLAQTRKYIEDAADDRTIRLEKGLLEQFLLKNGKVSIGKAMSVTGHHYPVIKRECDRHGLPTFHRRIRQTLCMDAVSAALGGVPYEMEWRSRSFMSAKNAFYRFDGYFESLGLIVEFHGHQHYTFPNAFMVDESYLPEYEALRERDRIKRALIEAAPGLTYFEVLEDEPYLDVMYLRGRLVQLGVVPPQVVKSES